MSAVELRVRIFCGTFERAQLRAGFQAAGASAVESDGFSGTLIDKIAALRRVTEVQTAGHESDYVQ